jgi:hypothetical protein
MPAGLGRSVIVKNWRFLSVVEKKWAEERATLSVFLVVVTVSITVKHHTQTHPPGVMSSTPVYNSVPFV